MSTSNRNPETSYISTNHASPLHQIQEWFTKAVPFPTEENCHAQIGVHLEEVAEMIAVLQKAGASQKVREELQLALDVLNYLQRQIKSYKTGSQIILTELDRTALLDAMCDQIVTSIGVAHMLDLAILPGLKEVADSNDSKFDRDGNPVFDQQRKIIKGPDYFSPDLSKFV